MATWYVAPTGTTTTGAGTRDNPFLCSAINWTSIAAGDTVYLRTSLGNYNETLTIGKSGSAGLEITIDSDPLDGGKAVIDGQSTRTYCITHSAKTYIILKNLIGRNTTGAGNIIFNFGGNWGIYNCTAENAIYGYSGGSGVVAPYLEGCTANECDYPLILYGISGNSTVKSFSATATTKTNTFYVAGGHTGVLSVDGLTMDGGTTSAYACVDIRNCTFASGSEIKNAILKNGKGGVFLSTAAVLTLTNISAQGNTSNGFNAISSSHDVTYSKCSSILNGGSGFASDASYNVYYNDCVANNNMVDGFTTTTGCHDFNYKRCISTLNATRNPTPGADGDGFTSHDTCYNLDFFFCAAFGNANTGFAMVGTTAGRIYHCTSAFNGNGTNTTRGGIFISTTGDNATAAAGSKSWKMKNSISYKDYPRNLYFTAAAIGSTSWSFDYNSYKALDDASFATIDGGSTNISWTTYKASYEANSKNEDGKVAVSGMLASDSPCIDAAPWMPGFNDGGQTDPWGKKVYGLPNIGADQGAGMPLGGGRSTGLSKHIK